MSEGWAVPNTSVYHRSRVGWQDTDASGHYHHGTIIRWVEEAEADLYREVGMAHLFGRIPRVRYEVDYLSRVWFEDEVETRLSLEHMGNSSMVFAFEVSCGDTAVAAGRLVTVNALPDQGAVPWPADVRQAFTGARSVVNGERVEVS